MVFNDTTRTISGTANVAATGSATYVARDTESGSVSLTFSWTIQDASIPAPSVPTGVSVGSATRTTLTVSWTAVTGATSYQVRVGTTTYDVLSGSSFTITELTAGTAYSISVRARNGGGESAYSTAVQGTTIALPAAPATPTGLTLRGANASALSFGWTAVARASTYQIRWTTTSGTYGSSDNPRLRLDHGADRRTGTGHDALRPSARFE